ncbi:MAG: amidohydrolase family protein [bacterium]|nr:amidohydrolase family protein [bacterium]
MTRTSPACVLYRASAVLVDERELLADAGIVVRGGRIEEVCPDAQAVRARARDTGVELTDLGRCTLAPGLVNAHSHLELHALQGRVPASGGFGAWVGRVIEARRSLGGDERERGVRAGAGRMLATGTTAVGDIDAGSPSAGASVLRASGLRVVRYREALDAHDPGRTQGALDAVRRDAFEASELFCDGLSAHAPFTVSPALFRSLAQLADEHALAVTVHWAETRAEVDWLRDGTGPLADRLGPSPGVSGLDAIERAGLLGLRTSLVHGNYPEPDDPARIARSGASVVHCPGSHAFFARERFPLERYVAAGVRLALGTDSAASNADVDMRREMVLLRAAHPELSAAAVWRAATRGAALALGMDDCGRLAPGQCADFVQFDLDSSDLEKVLHALTTDRIPVLRVWVDGRIRIQEGGAPIGAGGTWGAAP